MAALVRSSMMLAVTKKVERSTLEVLDVMLETAAATSITVSSWLIIKESMM